jgi:hypothetical protein
MIPIDSSPHVVFKKVKRRPVTLLCRQYETRALPALPPACQFDCLQENRSPLSVGDRELARISVVGREKGKLTP